MFKTSYTFVILLFLIFTNDSIGQTRVYQSASYEEQLILNNAKASHRNFDFISEYNYYISLQRFVNEDIWNKNVTFLKRKLRKTRHNAEIQCYLQDSYGIGLTYQYCGDGNGTLANYMLSVQFFPVKYDRSVSFMGEFYTNFRLESGTVDAVNNSDFQYEQQPDYQWEHVGASGGINILAIYPLHVYTMLGLGYGAKYTAYRELENTGTTTTPDFTFRRDVYKTDIETLIIGPEAGIIITSPHIGFTIGYKHYFAPIEGLVLGGGPKFGLVVVLPFAKWFGDSYCSGMVDVIK